MITARELHVFFIPSEEERVWAEEVMDSDGHQLALLVALKSYQRMGCFPKAYDVPEQVVESVRRAVELPESTLPVYASGRTAERHRSWVRDRCQVRYDGPAARSLAGETMRVEAASKNNPADLINVALETLVEARLEIPRFSTLDAMVSGVRGQVNEEILAGIRGRMTGEERGRLTSARPEGRARTCSVRGRHNAAKRSDTALRSPNRVLGGQRDHRRSRRRQAREHEPAEAQASA